MLVVVQQANEQRIVDVEVNDPAATFGDLADALGIAPDANWFVDGGAVSAGDGLVGRVFNGSVVADQAGPIDGGVGLRLDQIAGADVGWSRVLKAGPNVLGRSADVELQINDRSTSGRHCRLARSNADTVEVTDLGSRNGTRVAGQRIETASLEIGDVLWAGSGVYRLASCHESKPFLGATGLPGVSDRLSFNRPPRRSSTVEGGRIEIPPPVGPKPGPPVAFSIAAVVAPLIMAAAMVVILGNARYALFGLLSPVMAIVGWTESRHRTRRETNTRAVENASRIASFDAQMAEQANRERLYRWARQPDLCELIRWMKGPTTRLWERRSTDSDVARVSIGVADQTWRGTSGSKVPDNDLVDLIDRALLDVPVEVSLGPGEVVGIVGSLSIARSVARALTLALCATTGPSDLRVVVAAERPQLRDWGWSAWLPHTRDDGRLGCPWVLSGGDALEALAMLVEQQQKVDVGRAATDGRMRLGLLIVDGVSFTSGRLSAARRLWGDVARPWGGIVVAEREDQLPSECTVVVDVRNESGRAGVRWPRDGREVDNVQTASVTIDTAVVAARSVARLDDPDLVDESSDLPDTVSLADLDGIDAKIADSATAWSAEPDAGLDSLRAVVGFGVEGAVSIDLVDDGPHALVAGTTGSGKSEFLRTWIASLALGYSPSELNLVLIDYKGGSAFDSLCELPHVVGMVTDLDEHLGRRALVCLNAELKWRERVLREQDVGDINQLARGVLPRLVVVIDEFATLAAELPEFLSALVDIAQRGRSLGVHLILATRRPSGAVNDNIRANTNLRVALRVQDVNDSVDVVGTEAAAHLPRSLPGRACIRLGHDDVSIVQLAHATGPRASVHRLPVEVRAPIAIGPNPGQTTLSLVVDVCRDAFALSNEPDPRKPWPEPLPATIDQTHIDDMPASVEDRQNMIVVGIADEPAAQRRRVHGWSLDQGNLIIAGAPGSGADSALFAIASVAMKSAAPHQLHVHAIEILGSSLRKLKHQPHVGGVAGINEPQLLVQLVHRHRAELDKRIANGSRGQPQMLLLIDHLGGLIQDNQSSTGLQLIEDLRRVFTDGPSVGINTVVGVDRIGAIPSAWQSAAGQKWLFRLADPVEFQLLGLARSQLPSFVHGRGVPQTVSSSKSHQSPTSPSTPVRPWVRRCRCATMPMASAPTNWIVLSLMNVRGRFHLGSRS